MVVLEQLDLRLGGCQKRENNNVDDFVVDRRHFFGEGFDQINEKSHQRGGELLVGLGDPRSFGVLGVQSYGVDGEHGLTVVSGGQFLDCVLFGPLNGSEDHAVN